MARTKWTGPNAPVPGWANNPGVPRVVDTMPRERSAPKPQADEPNTGGFGGPTPQPVG